MGRDQQDLPRLQAIFLPVQRHEALALDGEVKPGERDDRAADVEEMLRFPLLFTSVATTWEV